MNTVEVYINGSKLELTASAVVAITKQINDIADIQKRQADFTNRFKALKTPANKIIVKHLNTPGNTSTLPYKWSTAQIVSNSIPILQDGVAFVTETTDAFEFLIYAGNYDLYSRISNKYITDIDWSDLDHLFDKFAWENNNTLAGAIEYIYPIVETLDGRITKAATDVLRVDLNYQFPHVFVKTIWDRIFAEAGLVYSGSFFSTNTKYKNTVVPACRNWVKEITTPFDYYFGNNPLTPNVTISSGGPGTVTHAININTNITASANYNLTTDIYTAPEDGVFAFTLKSTLAVSYLHKQNFKLKINGVFSDVISDVEINIELSFGVYIRNTVLVSEILLRQGDTVEFFTSFYSGGPINTVQLDIADYSLEIRQTSREAIAFGSVIEFEKWLPKIKQIDFLKAIMQQFGLIYQRDSTGNISFIKIEDLLTGSAGISNYTAVFNSEKSESYRIGSFSKKNLMAYAYTDDDKQPAGYADSSFLIDIDDLQEESTEMDSIIQASGDWLLFDNWQKIASIHAYKNTEDNKDNPPTFVLNDNNTLQTVVLATAPTTQIQMYDSLTDTVLGNYPFFSSVLAVAQFAPLHWEVLKAENYLKYIATVSNPVKKSVSIWFTPIDIYFLDMFKIIYLEQYQSYFYLNKINNFLPGKLSDCEIIKIN
jgi:hypothetical protein